VSEPNETFTVTLSAPVNAGIATAVATGTIVNDDGAVTSFTGPTTTGSGTATASFTGGGANCTYTVAALIPVTGGAGSPPPPAPFGYAFPHGLFDFTATSCTPGSTLHFTISYPQALPNNTVYWKYGPTAANTSPHWYQLPATINGNTASFDIVDGGLGDDDLVANGTIVDQGGPGVPIAPTDVPALSDWGRLLLAGLLGLFGWVAQRKRRV
jgi:trimeric autotransporter adhesin